MNTPNQPLTPRQQATLGVVTSKQETRRTGPTVREVASAMGVAANAVQRHVEALRKAGFVAEDAGMGLVIVKRAATRKPMPKPGGQLL